MNSLGEQLKRSRLHLNLDITELAERTKIRSEYLAALEEMRFDELPERLFTRAYIQRYATELGIDPAPLLAQYDTLYPPVEIRIPVSHGKPLREFPWGLVTSALSVMVVLSGLGWWLYAAWKAGPNVGQQQIAQEESHPQTPKTIQFSLNSAPAGAKVYLDNGLVGITPIKNFPVTQRPQSQLRVELDGYVEHQQEVSLNQNANLAVFLKPRTVPQMKIQAEVVPGTQSQTAQSQNSTVQPDRTPLKVPNPVVPEPSQEEQASTQTLRGVQLRFEGRSWTRVTDPAGKVLYEGTPGAGATLTFPGPVVIRTGSAGLVWVQVADGSEERMGSVGRIAERTFP